MEQSNSWTPFEGDKNETVEVKFVYSDFEEKTRDWFGTPTSEIDEDG